MKHTYHIKMRAALWVMLGVACFASSPAMAGERDYGCSPTVANPCTGGSSGGSGGGYSAPSYDYGAARRAQEAAEAASAAEAERQRQQAEAERIERERQAEIKRQKDAAFIRDRDAAANTLKGSSGSAMGQLKDLAGADNSGLKGSGFDSGSTGLKGLRGSDSVVDNRNVPDGLGGKSKSKGKQATPKPAPHTDTSVVDARNVPSGLPKSVDDAIPHSPSGDRVRKGFQAIQAGDWKAALAWFQDARNKEPGNPGLGRLVDLAKFTLEYRTRAPEVEKNSAPVQSTQLPNQNSIPGFKDGAVIKPGAVEPGDNSIASVAAGQMAARARADAAYKQYSEKYGEHYSAARTRAVSKAYRGEGYTDEELKAQLQKSLLEYRKNYRKNHPNGPYDSVGGSPAAEEIILGGKG